MLKNKYFKNGLIVVALAIAGYFLYMKFGKKKDAVVDEKSSISDDVKVNDIAEPVVSSDNSVAQKPVGMGSGGGSAVAFQPTHQSSPKPLAVMANPKASRFN